ncbi:MAG: T9SS type A sorting domain-containing protein [Flavobacteriales bacterium]
MKNFTLVLLLMVVTAGTGIAQCTSPVMSYDLVVSDNVALGPNGTQFTSAHVCSGGILIDSTMCCTRVIHVDEGGTYQAGPFAYGSLYLKSGATYDALDNTGVYVAYEEGATILNYSGTPMLCDDISFPEANCTTQVANNETQPALNVYPNPCTSTLVIEMPEGYQLQTITLYDHTGKLIMQSTPAQGLSKITMDVSTITPGLYMYSMIDNTGHMMQGRLMVAGS